MNNSVTLWQTIATIETLIAKVRWQRFTGELPHNEDGRGFAAHHEGWHFAVFDYGDTSGERRLCDGAVRNDTLGIVYHLTQDQAERAVQFALKQTGGN